ncbi:MAG: hypothetical protein WBB01_13020, partial [Phormidesmis sp.]
YSLRVNHMEEGTSFNRLLGLVKRAYEAVEADFFIDEDAFENFLRAMFEIGCVPDINARFDLMPVEYAAKAIISNSLLPLDERKSNYTFYNPYPLKWSDVVSYYKKLRKSIEVVPLNNFVDRYQAYIQTVDKKSMKLLKSVVSSQLETQLNTMFRDVDIDQADTYSHWCPPCEKQFTHTYIDFVLNG